MTGIDPDAYKHQEDLEKEAFIRQGKQISLQAGLPFLPENLSMKEAALLNKAPALSETCNLFKGSFYSDEGETRL